MAGPTGASVPGRSFLVRVWPPAPFLVRWDGRSFLVRGLAPGSVEEFYKKNFIPCSRYNAGVF